MNGRLARVPHIGAAMSRPSAVRYRTVVPAVARLICLALPLLACRGEAQSKPASAGAKFEEYRLTEPMVRKISAIMREWNPIGGLGAQMFGGDLGMAEEEFEKLPDSTQSRIIGENMTRADKREKEGRKQIEQLLFGKAAERTAAAERTPALKAAIAKAGLSTGEFIEAFYAYHFAMDHLIGEEGFPEATRPLQPGVRKDNVDLMRPMNKSEDLWNILGA
jgi:hypothetical protein